MFISELKRLYKNNLIRWIIPCLFITFNLFSASIFYGKENLDYKNELSQMNQVEIIENSYLNDQINAYSNYQNDIINRIESNNAKLNMSVFNDEFVRTQLESENQTLTKIQSMNVEIVPSYAITQFFESYIFSIIILVLCSLLIYSLFFEDILHRSMFLYKSTKNSLNKLFFIKLAVFLFIVIIFTSLCLGVIFLMTQWDGISLNTPIQWLLDYRFNITMFTLFDQIVLLMFIQAFAAIFIGVFVLMLVILFRNLSLGYGVTLLFLLSEYFLYSFTSVSSSFTVFKYINLYYYLFGTINHVQWVLVANRMFDFSLVSLLFSFALGFIVLLISLCNYKNSSLGFSNHNARGFQVHSTSLVWHEFLRTVFFNKGFLIVLLILIYSLNRYSSFTVSKSQGQLDYELIESRYYGELNETILNKISQDIDESHKALVILTNQNNDGQNQLSQNEYQVLDNKARPYTSLLKIKDKMDQLYNAGSKYFIDDNGYDFIFEDKSYFSTIIHFLLLTIAISLFISMNVHYEYQRRLTHLYTSTKLGHLKKQTFDLIIYYCICFIIVLMVYGLYLLKIQKGYVIYNQNLPLFAITTSTSSSISLLSYTLISFLLHLIVYISMVRFVYILSRKFDLVVVVVIMLGFALLQVTIFNFMPSLSILHLLTVSFLNNIWMSIFWVVILIVYNFTLQSKLNDQN